MEQLRTKEFIRELARITEPECFIGVARILKVELMEENGKDPRPFGDLFEDVIKAYEVAPRKRRRELLQILREANT